MAHRRLRAILGRLPVAFLAVVFVVVDGKAVLHTVTPAPQDVGTMKSIPAGVAVGDRVVLAPPASLQDGAAVRTEDASH